MNSTNSKIPQFNIIEIEDLLDKKEFSKQKEVCNDFYSVFFIHEGEITFSTTHLSIRAEYNSLLFIPVKIEHQILVKKKSKGSLIIFNEAFYNSIKQKSLLEDYIVFHQEKLSSIIRLSENEFSETLSLVNLLKLEIMNETKTSKGNIHQLLNYFLSKSKEKFIAQNEREQVGTQKKGNPIFNKFKQILESSYSTNRNVGNYANQLNIHPYCLNEISKLSSGHTASEVIHTKIISETKKLVLITDNSFKEISYKLGFDDPAYFSRYFKKHTGITLSQFKNETRDMSK